MDNSLRESKNHKLLFKREDMPYRVFATWNIHYACNYRCAYCHAPKPEHKDARQARYIPRNAWIDIWKRMYDRYGTWEMLISGGEPFAYPAFMELIIELSKIHLVGICTNLEWDVFSFVESVDPQRVRIETSFHPEFSDLSRFIEKLKALKSHGFEPTVNFVPWPPLLEQMKNIKEAIEAAGCQLTLQPFIGQFENRSYPQDYTEEERGHFRIFKDDCNLKTLDFKTTKESNSTKGKLCRMGQNYVFIHPDGEVSRCCRDHTFSLGNIIGDSFKLLEEPIACNAENCNCWRCMLVGKEDSWWQNWGRREITDMAIAQHKNKHDFRIALIQPPAWGTFEPPVSLAQLSSCLKKGPYQVSVFDLNIELYNRRKEQYSSVWAIEQSAFWGDEENVRKFFIDNSELIEEYTDKIVRTGPDLVGFSVNVCSLPATLMLADRLKQKIPQVKVVIGGPMFFVPADIDGIMQHKCIDVIVYGEGEETFSELPDYFMGQKDLLNCRGIYFRKNGEVIRTQSRQPIKDLDELPFLDLGSFPLEKYSPPGHLGNHISLMTSRGCVLNCVYCGPKAYWKGFRSMSGKRIYDEIKYHIQNNHAIEHIEFLDLELNGNMEALTELCNLMIDSPPKRGVRWHANIIIRPEMTKELLLKMKNAGCYHLSVGIETGSQRVLALMNKRYRVEDAERVLKYAYEVGIHVTTNFMFGFPGETEKDFNLTLDFLRRNASTIGTVYPSRTFFTIEPFSYLSGHLSEFGVVANPVYNLYWESADGINNYPERLRRCEEFSRLAIELGVSVGLGLQTSLELDRYYNLGFYYEYKKDFKKATEFFKKYLRLDPKNTVINKKLQGLKGVAITPAVESKTQDPKTGFIENNNKVEPSGNNGSV
ncbi:MAG: radical SAM protein, partial [Candidatus Omnitrophica bacterium]|nr:radical SAM protein [Candidatus Omnitrophota bacterium]